jgi:nitrite reductase/ring-hydroxylating ferredoxin subunit
MSKQSKACDISRKVKYIVNERDGGCCIICGKRGSPNAHFIGRAQGGLGIEENIVCLCHQCHHDFDNGDKREEYGAQIETYLRSHYPFWEKSDLVYNKHDYLDPRWIMGN